MSASITDKMGFLLFTSTELSINIDNLETRFREIPTWSSLNALIYVSSINEEYDVLITSADLATLHSFEDIYNIIVARINGNK